MSTTQSHLFLLPHQDDEFGVFHVLEDVISRGHRPVCVFLTEGSFRGRPGRRDDESRRVLLELGVDPQDIHFLGTRLTVPDGDLASHLNVLFDHVNDLVAPIGPLAAIYVPAWEGGHQDHDAAHALGVGFAAHHDQLAALRQFPLYNADRCRFWPYRVLSPVTNNGIPEATLVPISRRFRYLRLCLRYRSQAKTFLGLLPFIAAHYALRGVHQLQPVDPLRLRERPHEGPLLYERRNRARFEDLKIFLDNFIASRSTTRPELEESKPHEKLHSPR
jgi:LmbE family N-acetylglucosaminyl deacetylase